jgi:hypothetical protein
MEDRTMARIVEILETDPDFFVPVKKLWIMLQEEGLAQSIDLEKFHHLLEADDRLEFTSSIDSAAELSDNPVFAFGTEQEIETLEFYSGPKVKLISRTLTAGDIFAGMSQSLTQMNQALQNAWEARPENDQATEDQLLEILAAGQKLQREIQELVDRQSLEEI